MAFSGSNLKFHDRNRRARETTVGAYDRLLKELEITCAEIFLGFEHIGMPFIRRSDNVKYACLLSD